MNFEISLSSKVMTPSLRLNQKKIQEMLENFMMYQKNEGLLLSSVNDKLSALKLFFAMNNIAAIN